MSEKGAGTLILEELRALREQVDRLAAHLGANRPQASAGNEGGKVATAAEIKAERGDPKIRMEPKAWKGEPCKGLLASECPPDFLDVYADQLDWFASKNADAKKAGWDRLDAARCRRWAIEIRDGRHKQKPRAPTNNAPPPPPPDDDDPGAAVWNTSTPDNGGLPPPPDDDAF